MIIKKLFLPEAVNNYYLFPKRILGIDIGKTSVIITQILLSGKSITVEKTVSENIEMAASSSNGERAAEALKRAVAQCDSYHEIRTALSSTHIIFKELRLPFTTHGKIEKVINFEVEPLLPFALSDAAIDFIITAIDTEHQSAQVLVAAVQKQYIAQHMHIFEQAGLRPNIITVDLFAAYATYTTYAHQEKSEGIIALIDIGASALRIACIHDNQLRTIRTINKGINFIIKAISDAMNISPAQAAEHITRFGLRETDNPTYHKAIQESLAQLWSEVSFTLNSFAYQMKATDGIKKVYIFGGGANIRGVQEFIEAKIGTQCLLFDGSLLSDVRLSFKNKLFIDAAALLSLSTALPTPSMQEFNLLSEELSSEQQSLFNKQLLVTVILALAFLILITSYTFIQTSRFSWQVNSAQQEAVKALKEQFPNITTNNLAGAKDEALEEVEKEEKTWFAFSNKVRSSYLKYLLELHNKIDKQSIGLDLDKISISENNINIKGHVENFDAFRSLRKALRESELFGQPEAKEERDFTMTIPIISTEEE